MLDMDLADLDTDEFLGLTPTYIRSILLEPKECYKREDELIEALQIVRDDLDDVLKGTHLEGDGYRHYVVNGAVITKIRNFANDASQ